MKLELGRPRTGMTLGSEIANRLSKAQLGGEPDAVTEVQVAVDIFAARIGRDLVALADANKNPFSGGGGVAVDEWVRVGPDNKTTFMGRRFDEDPHHGRPVPIPRDSRADLALELIHVPVMRDAIDGLRGDRLGDAKLAIAVAQVRLALETHGLTLVGIGHASLNDPTPVLIYTSAETTRVAARP